MIRVLIVDDQALLRSALVNLLAAEEGIEVVGEAADGASAVESARRHRPDVVVMDVRMPGSDGITATADIVGDPDLAQTRILILTTFEVEENIVGALRAGASGFLAKDADPGEIVRAIRVVASGDALLSPAATRSVVERLLAQPQRLDAASPGLDNLTDREREVLGYVARGLSNDEIAGMLVVSPLTIKTHVSRILTKTGSRDRAQLVALAYSSGLIRPGAAG
ncbi:MAG: response regulator transcription factor [Actinobacteria bacterium]|nr:response regulator transcription factor [Actinomycetota bacterium]MCB9411915.1 response regulator transcription factor [Actinomycetota bacterium]